MFSFGQSWENVRAVMDSFPTDNNLIKSGVGGSIANAFVKNKNVDEASKFLSQICNNSHNESVRKNLISKHKIFAQLQKGKYTQWSPLAKEYVATAIFDLISTDAKAAFAVYPLAVYLLQNGNVGCKESAAKFLQTLSFEKSNRALIVNSSEINRIISFVPSNKAYVTVMRPLAAFFNNLSVGSNTSKLDVAMHQKGVLSVIAFLMNNMTDGETLRDALCFCRNATLSSEDIKVYLVNNCNTAIARSLQHESGPVREHAGGLIRNLGTNGKTSTDRKNKLIDAGTLPILVERLTDTHDKARLQGAYALWNLSNSSNGSKTILSLGLVPTILNIFDSATWSDTINGEVFKNKLVGVLCCLSANADEAGCDALRGYALHNYLHPLMMSKDPKQQPINAACGVANLVGHVENHPLLKADTTIFEMMCDCIRKTRRGEAYHGAYYSEWGLIRNLANMSIADSNKSLLKKTASVECACEGFQVGRKYVKLEECVAKLLSNMSFSYDLKKDFKWDLRPVAQSIKTSSRSTEAQHFAEIALFQHKHMSYTKKDYEKKMHTIPQTSKHVMISCSPRTQQFMLFLKHGLEQKGLRVWLNTNTDPFGNFDAMMNAVEGSYAVLVCMDAVYKESPACRSEADYANKLGCPIIPLKTDATYSPDGWLQSLVGQGECFDLSTEDMYNANLPAIIDELTLCATGKWQRRRQQLPAQPQPHQTQPQPQMQQRPASPPPPYMPPQEVVKQPTAPPITDHHHPTLQNSSSSSSQQQQQQQPVAPKYTNSSVDEKLALKTQEGLTLNSDIKSTETTVGKFHSSEPITEWDETVLCQWLDACKLSFAIEHFKENGVDGCVFAVMQKEDFEECGFTKFQITRIVAKRQKEIAKAIGESTS
eukprot:m.171119 g.171119  ORF g.171119 m.171119 type:complete len:880 (-) comp13495_c2_seq2:4258-6897(-)